MTIASKSKLSEASTFPVAVDVVPIFRLL